MLYRTGESKNSTLAVSALSILILESGLTAFLALLKQWKVIVVLVSEQA
jgi:hypothetical protein